ncbi:uncharacterized protein LOC129578574 [Sitodiplosis mosellana]|uniref:uncharacterized protein LOC129578574 n=1 Tax=Sitodiplosis mosellana TaxID=263140 RepID=UPI002444F8E3|nr:uncharacterized protein LOC129578574 [Sitodiplosis mosellana]
MFITAIQNVIKRELFRGSMHRGKYRYVRPIKAKEMQLLREEYLREERVMQLLLNPYLKQEESLGHTAAFDKKEKRLEEIREGRRIAKLKPNTLIEDRLKHLTVKDVWD